MIDLRPKGPIDIDFGTNLDPDLEQNQFFHFFVTDRWGVLGIKYELNELRI